MLVSLRIRNLALIEDLTWELAPGFNILTGETGAGKSILIDALSLLLGERADKSLIRTGAESCTVEAEVALTDAARRAGINARLVEAGAEPCEEAQLFLKRTVSAAGANRQFINGSPVPLQTLKALGAGLVDLHGPHDHQSLLSTETQTELLDAFGQLAPLRQPVRTALARLREIEKERDALEMSDAEREQRVALLRHQVGEIAALKLTPGEDSQLENDYRAASHAQALIEFAAQIGSILSDAEPSVLGQLAQIERLLTNWQRVDPTVAEAEQLNRQAIAQLQELALAVQDRAERVDLDPAQLQALEERLNQVQSLKRKYGGSIEAVLAFGEKAAADLTALEDHAERRAQLAAQEKAARQVLAAAAGALTEGRRKVAPPLGDKVAHELQALGFAQAHFQVGLALAPAITALGADAIEFIFAPNQGEAARPLRAIASSGEMARVMLAIKTTLAEVDDVPILIFDEVDANVGGETASQVGRKLRALGLRHQVLCITHLPQVAAQGEAHFSVEKRVKNERTTTALVRLDPGARQREIARMLGGQTDAARHLAQTLLGEAS